MRTAKSIQNYNDNDTWEHVVGITFKRFFQLMNDKHIDS